MTSSAYSPAHKVSTSEVLTFIASVSGGATTTQIKARFPLHSNPSMCILRMWRRGEIVRTSMAKLSRTYTYTPRPSRVPRCPLCGSYPQVTNLPRRSVAECPGHFTVEGTPNTVYNLWNAHVLDWSRKWIEEEDD